MNRLDNNSHTALLESLKGGHYELARYLYKHGGKVLLGQDVLATILCYMVKRNELYKLQVKIIILEETSLLHLELLESINPNLESINPNQSSVTLISDNL